MIAGLCAPFVNGIIMERIIKKNQSDVNKIYADTGSDVTLEIVQYDRHFKSSDIVWKLHLGKMKNFYGVEEIIFVDHAKHGITSIVSTTSLDQNPWFSTFLDENMGGKNPLNIITTYGVSGNIKSTITIDAFSIEKEGEVVDIKPGTFVVECESGFEKLSSKAVWDGMTVADMFAIDQIKIDYDLKKITNYIWDGTATYEVERIQGKDQNNPVEIKDLSGKYFLDYNEKSLSTGIEFSCNSLSSPEFSLDDASVKIEVNDLDSQGYEDFMELYTHTAYSAIDSLSDAGDDPEKMKDAMDQQMATAGLQMLTAYEKFLKKGLELKISKLHAKLPSGKVKGNMKLLLNQDLTFAQLAPITQQPNLAFELVSLDSELSFPTELGQDNPMLTVPFYPGMKTGFFEQDGKKLVHRAKTKDGKLFLNGQEVTFE